MSENGARMSRRRFLGSTLSVAALAALGEPLAEAASPKIIRRGEMVYRRLGRTELMVSELGIGGSPSPEPAVFSAALDRGINYMDTSVNYGNGNGERLVGRVVKGRRDKVHISTKFPLRRVEDNVTQGIITAAEQALQRLQTDYIDIWCIHGVTAAAPCLRDEVLEAFEKLKQQGKIRFAGVSCHRDPANVLPPIIESGRFDVVLLAFNVFSGTRVTKEDVAAGKVYDNWLEESGLQKVLDLAKQHDVGLVAMKTMAGGARQNLAKFQTGNTTLAQAKLKWVLSHDAVASALSEVLTFRILEENLGAVGQTLTPQDEALLREHVVARTREVCRFCGRCATACPARLPIPEIMRCLVYYAEHKKRNRARALYRAVAKGYAPELCRECNACLRACPHGLDVRQRLARAHALLA